MPFLVSLQILFGIVKYKKILKKHSRLLLIITSIFLVIIFNNSSVLSTSFTYLEHQLSLQAYSDKLAQGNTDFSEINFDSNYYSSLLAADNFYKQGNLVKVKQIQRKVKPDFTPTTTPKPPQVNVENLSPGGRVYWRNANAGLQQGLESKIFISLEKLTETSPDFIPGHLLLVKAYEQYEKEEEALSAIERLAELYPEQTDVLDKKIELLDKNKKYLEASIAARQFAITYPNYQESSRYQVVAEAYKTKYLKKLNGETLGMGLVGIGLEIVFNQNQAGLQVFSMLSAGEAETGAFLAEAWKQNLTLVNNQQVLEYVDGIGQQLATLMGRDEFEYEFFIAEAPAVNAFALPGGKIFITTGMLRLIDSEAELAGILSHEIAHSVLSHGFQGIAKNSITSMIPFGQFVNAELNREQEKQADILGTRVLASAKYSADGIYNVMAKLKQLEGKSNWSDAFLATHPASETRMQYLEEIIQTNGYNRYAYEGVKSYQDVFGS